MTSLPLPFTLPAELEAQLRAAYAEPPRAYHNFEHVGEVLEQMATVTRWEDEQSVAFAVLFHDAVYVAGRSDNEQRSAQLAAALLPKAFPAANLRRIDELILLTAKHGRLEAKDVDPEAALFLDCDMAILGAAAERYDMYERQIASEYAAIPEELYRAGRASFLRGLLAKPRLYLSEEFYGRLEERARENIRRALGC